MFRNMSIAKKLMLVIYSYLLVMFILLSVIAFAVIDATVKSEMRESSLNNVIHANLLIEKEQQYLYGIAKYYSISPEVQDLLVMSNAGLHTEGMTDELISVSKARMYVLGLALYNINGDVVDYMSIDNSSGPVNQSNTQYERPFTRLINEKRTFEWEFIDQGDTVYLKMDNSPKLCLWYVIKSTNTMRPIGALAISIDTRKLLTAENIFNDLYNNIIILDTNGRIVYSKNESLRAMSEESQSQLLLRIKKYNKTGSFVFDSDKAQYLVAYGKLANSNLITYILLPYTLFSWNARTMICYVLVCIILASLMLPIGFLIRGMISKPLNILICSMEKFRNGNRSVQVPFKYRDEIGRLGMIFNQVLSENNALIEKTYILKIKEQEAELTSMQAQINPHFLYNMINHMQWMALRNGQEEIADIAYSIGQVFRMSLNRGNGMITVMKECEIIQYYIELQEKRFENRLTFELDVEPAAFNAIIPKLIIQPIIENSILHGVNDSTGAVHIMVTIRLIQNSTRLEIIVQDDGVGIPPEVLDLLPDRLSEGHTSTSSSGFALKNISDRLRLTYNNNYVFDIKSVPGSFTSSRIVVDYHTEMPATQNMPK